MEAAQHLAGLPLRDPALPDLARARLTEVSHRGGRNDGAKKIFQRFHKPASGQDFVESQHREVLETIAVEKEFAKREILELWSSKSNRHRLTIVVTVGIFSQVAGAS